MSASRIAAAPGICIPIPVGPYWYYVCI
jgi:hypothetical protein